MAARSDRVVPPRSAPDPAEGVRRHGRSLLELLFGDLADGELINVRFLRTGVAWNRFAGSIEEAVALAAAEATRPFTNVLVGVLPRRGEDGTAHGVTRGGCLWADLDAGREPGRVVEAWRRLAGFPLRPTAVAHSGRGLHAYWLLRESIPLPDEAARRAYVERIRNLARVLGADPAVADVARVLRLPGSANHKYQPPQPTRLLAIAPGRRYALDELDAHVTPPELSAPESSVPPRSGASKEPWVTALLLRGAPLHERNVACARLAGYFHQHGLPRDVIGAIILGFAARCRPPLDPREATAVVHSITRYPVGSRQ